MVAMKTPSAPFLAQSNNNFDQDSEVGNEMTNGQNIVHKKGTTTKCPLLGSETKNEQNSQFTPGIWDIHKNQTKKS